jgi:hypothetical protein
MQLRHCFVVFGAISLLATAALAQSPEISFNIRNISSEAINQIFVASTNQSSWGADNLGAHVLNPGASITIKARSCMNDIRVVFKSGREIERRQVNICVNSEMNFR